MKKVLCVGQVAYDITLLVDSYPLENKKMRTKGCVECAGGSAFNCAYLLNSWGIDTTYVGSIGNDYYGKRIEEEAKEGNLKAVFSKYQGLTTTSYIIANVSNGTRTILTNKNLDLKVINKDIDDDYDLIMLDSNEFEFSLELVNKYKSAIKVLDAGKMCENVMVLGHLVDYFVCSKDFAEKFTGISLVNFDDFVRCYDIIDNEFSAKVIITLEDVGSFTKVDGNYELVPSISVKAIDSTGAGDIYHGALGYFILNGYPILKCMRYANIAGALSTKKVGSKMSMPKLEDIMLEDEII